MPSYVYKHPRKGKYVEVIQTMTEQHIYIDSFGVNWDRVFVSPQALIKDYIDPFSGEQYVEATKNKKGSVGDLQDLSEELYHKRMKSSPDGRDKVIDAFYDSWSKKRCGRKHPEDTRVKKKEVREKRSKLKAKKEKKNG